MVFRQYICFKSYNIKFTNRLKSDARVTLCNNTLTVVVYTTMAHVRGIIGNSNANYLHWPNRYCNMPRGLWEWRRVKLNNTIPHSQSHITWSLRTTEHCITITCIILSSYLTVCAHMHILSYLLWNVCFLRFGYYALVVTFCVIPIQNHLKPIIFGRILLVRFYVAHLNW